MCDRERGRGGGNKVMGEKERGVTNEGGFGVTDGWKRGGVTNGWGGGYR